MVTIRQVLTGAIACLISATWALGDAPSIIVDHFEQEVRTEFTTDDGLPSNDILSIILGPDDVVYAGTAEGLAAYRDGQWETVEGASGAPVHLLGVLGEAVLYSFEGALHVPGMDMQIPLPENRAYKDLLVGAQMLATDAGLYQLDGDGTRFEPVDSLNEMLGDETAVYQLVMTPRLHVGAASGLFHRRLGHWYDVTPGSEDGRRWAPTDVRALTMDSEGNLWFGSAQGVGVLRDEEWTLYTGEDGLPVKDFTCAAAGGDGAVWFGTAKGAIRYDGGHWAYRQGRRWLPDDEVRDIAVTEEGHAWIATAGGISLIERRPMSLAEKATFYEDQIDRYHRRTPWEYVLEVGVGAPGDPSDVSQRDSDNDGLWTSMYGAGQCYAYAATGNEKAKERAHQAFEALYWLGEVTQGGSHPAPPGFVARTILPTDGPDPNERPSYTLEGQQRRRDNQDPLWRAYEPRWPVSECGDWYWKSDTSSDELDGHFYFYPLYYDLVCETEEEKERVREHVRAIMDHLIEHDFQYTDHKGPTRWGYYDPETLNQEPRWYIERGLKSLSLLSYLAVTEHMTGDPYYGEVAQALKDEHSYHMNMMVPKIQRGIGSGNQSDDEMAFMCFYNLLKYTDSDDPIRAELHAFYLYWTLIQPEMNPFFNFAYAVHALGIEEQEDGGWVYAPSRFAEPWESWLGDGVETLKRFPLDRFNWAHENSHRLDIDMLPPQQSVGLYGGPGTGPDRGTRVNGKVIPVDERHFNHWNHDPFRLDLGGNGRTLSQGAVYLLPYYMGLYYGFIDDEHADRLNEPLDWDLGY